MNDKEVWVGLCPNCHKQGLVLGAKAREYDPAILYCPDCRKSCSLMEVLYVRL